LDDSVFRDGKVSFATNSLAIAVLPHEGSATVLSVGFWFGLSEWFETLTGATTRLRTTVESLDGAERVSLDRRSLVCVCAAVKAETASNKASRSENLFMLTLNSVVSARFISQGTGHRIASKSARKNRGLVKVDKRRKVSSFRKLLEFVRVFLEWQLVY
jgi:hypothetical protein